VGYVVIGDTDDADGFVPRYEVEAGREEELISL
jgi:hypothetical protein